MGKLLHVVAVEMLCKYFVRLIINQPGMPPVRPCDEWLGMSGAGKGRGTLRASVPLGSEFHDDISVWNMIVR